MTIADTAHVDFQCNHAKISGGAIYSIQHVTIAGSVQFINNSATQGGAIQSTITVTTDKNSQIIFQINHAKTFGGAIASSQHVTIAGSVQFNSASHGGAIMCGDTMTVDNNAQVLFQGNNAAS